MGKIHKYNYQAGDTIQNNHSSPELWEKNFVLLSTLFPFERHKDLSKTKNLIISSVGKDYSRNINSRKFGRLLNRALQIMEKIKFVRRKANKRIIRDEARAIHFLAIALLEKISDRDNPARTLIITDKSNLYSKPSEKNKEVLNFEIESNLIELLKRINPALNTRILAGRPPSDYPSEYVNIIHEMACILLGIDKIPKNFIITNDKNSVTTNSSLIFLKVGQALDPSLTAAQVRTYLKRRQEKSLAQKSSAQ